MISLASLRLPRTEVVDVNQVGCIGMRIVDIHRKDVGFVGHILAANWVEQGKVVVVGPEYIGFGTGLVVVVGILNRLEDFEFVAPQLDFAGSIQMVEECFGSLMYFHFVGFASQLY